MIHIRIIEALQHVAGELLQLFDGQVERLHEFVELHLMDILGDDLVLTGVAHDIHATQEGHRTQNRMRTVQQCHLTFVVGLLRGHEQHVQSGLVGWELLCYLPRGLNHPEVEVLGLNHEVVAIRNLLLNLGDILAGEARHDTIH